MALASSRAERARARQPVFYYDLGSVHCYLAAELIASAPGEAPEWEPVLGAQLGLVNPGVERPDVERLARSHELQPLRWPPQQPPDTRAAMLVATYAKQVGRAVAFSLAAFRQAFAGGRDLSDTDTVLIAAAACEMHPTAVLKAIELRSVSTALSRAGERAAAAGVRALPALQIGERLFCGPEALRESAIEVDA
jgi:2-hydroxychromene-2-carboxylate isomerase